MIVVNGMKVGRSHPFQDGRVCAALSVNLSLLGFGPFP